MSVKIHVYLSSEVSGAAVPAEFLERDPEEEVDDGVPDEVAEEEVTEEMRGDVPHH